MQELESKYCTASLRAYLALQEEMNALDAKRSEKGTAGGGAKELR